MLHLVVVDAFQHYYLSITLFSEDVLWPISTQEKFPRTDNFPKISLLREFSTSNFFRTENLCRPITFYFLRKIFLSGNGPWEQYIMSRFQSQCGVIKAGFPLRPCRTETYWWACADWKEVYKHVLPGVFAYQNKKFVASQLFGVLRKY
jgi:hypothetical protein